MSTDPQGQPARAQTTVWIIIAVVLACLLGFCLIISLVLGALLLPAIQAAREAARRNMCMNNLKQVGVALLNYHETYRSFPPAYIADADGKPMHSWRVLLLPFLEENAIYQRYDFNEPWNGPNNSKLADALTHNPFRCPSADESGATTNYVAVVGAETVWPGSTATTLPDIARADGTSNTILVVEVSGSGINWMEPKDLTFEEALAGVKPSGAKPSISSKHVGGVSVLYCDAHVQFLPEDTRLETLRGLLTAAGREPVEPPQ